MTLVLAGYQAGANEPKAAQRTLLQAGQGPPLQVQVFFLEAIAARYRRGVM